VAIYEFHRQEKYMKKTALIIASGLFMASNAFATDANDTRDKVEKALAHIPSGQTVAAKGSFAMVYGGQDISHGNFGSIDSPVLAG
jgi:hypothetical protein